MPLDVGPGECARSRLPACHSLPAAVSVHALVISVILLLQYMLNRFMSVLGFEARHLTGLQVCVYCRGGACA